MRKSLTIAILIFFFSVYSFSQTRGTLTVKFTTTTYSGQYKPRHVLAAWITNSTTNSSATFVKTMYATSSSSYRIDLSRWKQATSTYNTTDATTGATLASHGSIDGGWNSLTTVQATVPDGTYYVWVEFTEDSSTGKYATFSFTKGATATTAFTTVTSSTWITMNSLSWMPANTPVKEIEAGKDYKIYPNPVKDYLNITGTAFQKANVYNAVGKLIYTSETNKINFSKYPKGAYVLEIITQDGTFYRKALKQ